MVAHSNIIQNKLKPLNKYMNDEDEKMISPSSNSLKSLSKNGAIPNSHIFINQIN